MNTQIEQMISVLLIDEEAKNSLRVADRVLNSKSEGVRSSAFVPLVIAGEGCGFSSYGRVYSAIVDASASQPIRVPRHFWSWFFRKTMKRMKRCFTHRQEWSHLLGIVSMEPCLFLSRNTADRILLRVHR